MDALPDELLLAVLGRVHDGLTLLDAVPLVCKRWNSLSRDPRAWAGVDLEIRFYDAEGGALRVDLDEARIALHAPALRFLELIFLGVKLSQQRQQIQITSLGSLLRRVSARIASVELYSSNDSSLLQPSVDEFTGLVQRNQEWLRSVNVSPEVRGDDEEEYAQLSSLTLAPLHAALRGCAKLRVLEAMPYVVAALDGLPHLVELSLDVLQKGPRPAGDWSTWSLPGLRRLQYEDFISEEGLTDSARRWSGELLLRLCCAAPGLTRLGVTCGELGLDWDSTTGRCICLVSSLPVALALPFLPSLRRLDAHGGPELVAAMRKLPALKKANVIVSCKTLVASIVAQRVAQLHAQRPDLALKVTVVVDQPQVTLKLGEFAESDED